MTNGASQPEGVNDDGPDSNVYGSWKSVLWVVAFQSFTFGKAASDSGKTLKIADKLALAKPSLAVPQKADCI